MILNIVKQVNALRIQGVDHVDLSALQPQVLPENGSPPGLQLLLTGLHQRAELFSSAHLHEWLLAVSCLQMVAGIWLLQICHKSEDHTEGPVLSSV